MQNFLKIMFKKLELEILSVVGKKAASYEFSYHDIANAKIKGMLQINRSYLEDFLKNELITEQEFSYYMNEIKDLEGRYTI